MSFEFQIEFAQGELGMLSHGRFDGQDEDACRYRLNVYLEPAVVTVREREFHFFPKGHAFLHATLEQRKDGSLLDARPGVRHALTEQFGVGAPILHRGGVVQVQVAPLEVEELTAFEHAVERALVALLVPLEGLLQALLFADVEPDSNETDFAIHQDALASEVVGNA
jgi:hypothetical protein